MSNVKENFLRYLQKDFFDAPDGYESESSPAPLEEYSRWEDVCAER